jgi:hypothetical protein
VKLNRHIIFNELCGPAPELISGRETGLNLEQVKYPRKGVGTGNNEEPRNKLRRIVPIRGYCVAWFGGLGGA